ncbi:MAG: ATP-binding cassette domain-containing protein [Myxococcota bacterium]
MLDATAITKRFGTVIAVEGLTLRVEPGEIRCLLGANGAGKTTTIQLFLGFLRPDEGSITVNGIDPGAEPRKARAQLAYIPENVSLYPELTGFENLDLFERMAGRRPRRDALEQALVDHGLVAEQVHQRVQGYSKGMRQKVGLAIASIRNAQVLLLDEPMSGLDPLAANEFAASLLRQRDAGRAILMTTHDIFRAQEVATHISILRSGALVESIDAQAVDAAEVQRLYLHHMRAAS